MKSKRFEVLASRPVNQDGYVREWPEVGLIAMNSPFDPTPGIKIENGRVTELDGKTRAEFDMLDTFIADHAIRLENAEKAMAMDSLEIARKIVDINVSRKEILDITLSITPAKLTEVVGKMTIVEIMMGMSKMRARLMPANQCHVTNVKDNPVQIAASDYNNATPLMRATLVKVVNEDLEPLISQVKCPTLLIWGDLDTATPIGDARRMEELIADAGLVVCEGAGHFSYAEQPAKVNGALRAFFG